MYLNCREMNHVEMLIITIITVINVTCAVTKGKPEKFSLEWDSNLVLNPVLLKPEFFRLLK